MSGLSSYRLLYTAKWFFFIDIIFPFDTIFPPWFSNNILLPNFYIHYIFTILHSPTIFLFPEFYYSSTWFSNVFLFFVFSICFFSTNRLTNASTTLLLPINNKNIFIQYFIINFYYLRTSLIFLYIFHY